MSKTGALADKREMDNTEPVFLKDGLSIAIVLQEVQQRNSDSADNHDCRKAMTERETIQRIQSADYTSASAAYHFLQPEITRLELSDGSTVARLSDEPVKSALMGDPLTPAGDLARFAKTISSEYPEASLFHIEKNTALALQEQGYATQQLGVEHRVMLPLSLRGKDKADLRRALNRSTKAGVVICELSALQFEQYEKEISSLNQNWLKRRKYYNREFRFLARPYVTRYQPNERRFLAFKNQRPIGIAIYDPVYSAGVIIGYFEAIVRCFEGTTGTQGVRDHLTITAMRTFATSNENIQWVSLGLCPFAPAQTDKPTKASVSLTQLILRAFYRYGNRVFNCRGLAFHKSRYRGQDIPIFFATKSRFPLVALYRACRLSHIDPLQAVTTDFLTLLGSVQRAKLVLREPFPSAKT